VSDLLIVGSRIAGIMPKRKNRDGLVQQGLPGFMEGGRASEPAASDGDTHCRKDVLDLSGNSITSLQEIIQKTPFTFDLAEDARKLDENASLTLPK